MLFYRGELVRIGPDNCYIGEAPANTVAFGWLPLVHRLVYVLVGVVRATPILMIFWSLRALFRRYAGGEVFPGPPPCVLAGLAAGFAPTLLVLVIGQVMQVGREIEEDREAFV